MAMAATQVPLQGYGQSILRTPRYNKATKSENQQTKEAQPRVPSQLPSADEFPLRKVGAFGVSVKKSSLVAADYSAFERVTDHLDDVIEEQETEEKEEVNEAKRLPPVEFTIRKKIKRRIMLRHAFNPSLAVSDRQLIEDLRHDLRTNHKEPDGTKSVLEAIGDPKIRESRFYHEPLKKFLAGNLKQQMGKANMRTSFLKHGYNLTTLGYPSDIKLVNVSVPPSQQHFNTPVDPRHLLATTQTAKNPRGGAKHGHPAFPKVINPHRFDVKVETRETSKPSQHNANGAKHGQSSLSPSSGRVNENDPGRNTDFSLPSIALLHGHGPQESEAENPSPTKQTADKDRKANRKENSKTDRSNRNAKAIRQRMGRPPPPTRPGLGGQSAAIKTTATGKSHLIGPMNKMDMIVEYSKLLQSNAINYDQYINKLSKLSLHKIDLGNSGLRHYHLIRDGSTGMKPRLARVDVYPTRDPPQGADSELNTRRQETAAKSRRADRMTNERQTQRGTSTALQSRGGVTSSGYGFTPYDNPSPNKYSQLRISRVSIGEGIPESGYEYYNAGYDAYRDQYLTYDDVIRLQHGTDMDRYRHVHRPHNVDKHGFHWSHLASKAPYTSAGNRAHNVSRPFDSRGGELYTGHAGKLPNSREMKKRLNFSYPSYDVMVDGGNHVTTADNKTKASSGAGPSKDHPDEHDPDYLAITLDKPNDKPSPTERAVVTSSLSVHDVTIPTDVTVTTAGINQRTGTRKGLTLGLKDPKTRDASSSPVRGNFETLNITPIAITSSNAVNPNPASSKSPYYVSQDDFATSGTDGVLQTHLNTIYRSIYKAKAQKDGVNLLPGKDSPPNVLIKRLTNPNKAPSVTADDEAMLKIALDNSKLLQPHKRLPRTPPPRPSGNKDTSPRDLVVPSTNGQALQLPQVGSGPLLTVEPPGVTQSLMTSSLAESSSPLTQVERTSSDSPPPPAILLQTREDEVTSIESDVTNDDVTYRSNEEKIRRTSSPAKINNNEIRLLTSSVELAKNGNDVSGAAASGEKPRLEVVITSLPAAPPSSEAETSDEDP